MDSLLHLTLLRHGRSLADDEGKFEGRYDSPLTEVGQAQALGRAQGWLRAGLRFDRVIASSLQRAHSTARIVAETLGAPLELDPDWMEVNNGRLAGLTYAEGDLRYPRPAFRGPFEPIAESGESEIQIHARADLALEKIIRRGAGRTLVVAHGGILNAALRVVCAAPLPVNGSGVWFSFGDLGYCHLTYDPGRHLWSLKELSC
jgi:2,3-bisphosphoglycerate-dependent phosphoglycerate mutase